jgi:hypothetical protein
MLSKKKAVLCVKMPKIAKKCDILLSTYIARLTYIVKIDRKGAQVAMKMMMVLGND